MNVAAAADSSRTTLPAVRADADMSRATGLILASVTILGAVLRFWRLGHQGYWYDEGVTVALLHHPLSQMLGLLPQSEGTPPVYYVAAWTWARVFGFGEAGLRSLSALAGVCVIPVAYGIGARLISRRAGLVAAALAACNPFLVWYSQEARSYSLLVLLSALSLLALVHLRSPRVSLAWLFGWMVAAGLTLATHYYGALIVVPEAIWLLWLHRRDRMVWVAVGAVAAVGLALLPLALSQTSNTAWIAKAPLGERLGQIAPQFVIGTGAPARGWLKLAGAVAVLLALALLTLRADAGERRGALLAGALSLVAILLGLALVAAGFDELITRNVIVVLVPLIVLIAGGLGARRAGVLGLAATATLCTIGLIATIAVAVDWKLERPAWGAVARAVVRDRPAGAASAIILENNDSPIPLAGYLPGLSPLTGRGALVQEISVVAAVTAPADTFCWWGAACSLPLAPLDRAIALRGFHPAGAVIHVNQFSIERLRARKPVLVTPAEVAGALTGAPLRSYGLLVVP